MPVGRLEVVVEPAEEDLVRRESKELVERLAVLEEAVELGVDLDVDLGEKTTTDNLPDKTKDEVLPALLDVAGTNVDDRTSNTLGRGDDNVVVLGHLEGVELLALLGLVEHTLVDGVGHRVVDELAEDEAVWCQCLTYLIASSIASPHKLLTANLVEQLHRVRRDGQQVPDIRVAGQHTVDVVCKRRALILVDRVLRVGSRRALDGNTTLVGRDSAISNSSSARSSELAHAHWLVLGSAQQRVQLHPVLDSDLAARVDVDVLERLAGLPVSSYCRWARVGAGDVPSRNRHRPTTGGPR